MRNGEGCFLTGRIYIEKYTYRNGVETDYLASKDYFDSACNLKYSQGCILYGDLTSLEALRDMVLTDKQYMLRQAKKRYGKACDLENKEGCKKFKELNEKGL